MGSEMCIRDRGVERVVGVKDIHAIRFSCFSFLCCFVDRLCAHTSAPYVSFGLIMPVYTHLISFGFGPKYELVLRVIRRRSVLHCSIFWFMCGVQLSVLSIVTPKYRVESTVFSFVPFILSLVKIFLFLGENTIATVFSGLNVRLAARLLSTK